MHLARLEVEFNTDLTAFRRRCVEVGLVGSGSVEMGVLTGMICAGLHKETESGDRRAFAILKYDKYVYVTSCKTTR